MSRAGRLDKRVILLEPSETRDAKGQPVKTWVNKGKVWAGIEPLRGNEAIAAAQDTGYRLSNVIMRERTDVTHDWRISYGSRTLEVDGPPIPAIHAGAGTYMTLRVIEVI